MRTHVISCEIFKDIVEDILKQYSLDYKIEYLDMSGHNEPKQLRKRLQDKINSISDADRIILLYGICGNATCGLQASHIPITIPRVHDCCAVLLGGNQNFLTHFSNRLSQGWASYNYEKENHEKEYQEFLEKYDEETAKYLLNSLYPSNDSLIYLDLNHPSDANNVIKYRNDYEVEVIKGDRTFLERVLTDRASLNEVHVIKPYEKVHCIYDYEEVLTSK